MSDSLDKLLDLLDLEQIEVNIFRGRSPDETVQRVYGGQVAGQALVAAGGDAGGVRRRARRARGHRARSRRRRRDPGHHARGEGA